MRALSLACLLAIATLPACSFLGLDNIPVAGCASDSECTDLRDEEAPPDDCHSWQCNPVSLRCELDVLDDDEDGAPRMLSPTMATCAMGAAVDCNDDPSDPAARTTLPGAAEACNGLDNDCDGLIDEGAVDVSSTCDAASATRELEVGVARAGGFSIAELLYNTEAGLRHLTLPADGDPTEGAITATPALRNDDETLSGMAFVRAGEWAVLRSSPGTCTSPFLQRLRPSTGTLDGDRVGGALPIPGETVCTTTASMDLAVTQLGAIAAGTGGEGVVAYVESGTLTSCSGGTATPQTLAAYLSVASLPAAGDYTVDDTPIALGEHAGRGAPALLSVADDVYLAALPRPDGTVEILEIDTAGAAPVATSVYVEAGTSPADRVALAAGEDGQYALSFDFVCPRGIRTRLFTWTAGGSATAGALISDERPAAVRPGAVFQPALSEWLVTWTNGAEAQGARFDVDGGPIGAIESLATGNPNVGVVGQALEDGRAYRLFTLRDPAAMPPTDVPMCPAVIALGCLPPG